MASSKAIERMLRTDLFRMDCTVLGTRKTLPNKRVLERYPLYWFYQGEGGGQRLKLTFRTNGGGGRSKTEDECFKVIRSCSTVNAAPSLNFCNCLR